jgi:large subunit ribosomal protein L15
MTMRLGNIRPAAGATKNTKRLGKGAASGQGGTSGKGHKGKKARSGGGIPVWFEGGQMPIQRRLPKRGFINPGRVEYQVVQVGRLAGAPAGTTIDAAWLKSAKIVRRSGPIKLLSGGELKVALTVKVDAASETARQAIEAAGGKVETPQPETASKEDRKREPRKRETPNPKAEIER